MIKRFLIAFVLLALVGGGLVYFNMFRNQAIQDFFASQQQPAVPVSTVAIELSTWQPGIEAIGTMRAARGVDLSVEAGGVVREVNFTSNDLVEEGELLVQIDDTIEQADLAAARAAVALSEQTLERARELRTRGVSAEASLEEAQANAQSARAQVARLQAVLSQKALVAPFTGTIGLPQIEPGQYVTTGAVVATLQDLETMRVDFSVPEQQLPLLEIGQSVRLGQEEGDLSYSGTIIGIEPRIDPATRLVSVRAEVENEEFRLNPGQFVRVRVELPVEPGVIALPQTAVVTSLYGDYVYVVEEAEETGGTESTGDETDASGAAQAQETDREDGQAQESAPALVVEQVFVETGRRNGNFVEITEGLSEGEIVVSVGQNRLSNGMRVTIDEEPVPLERNVAEQVAQ